MASKHFSNTVAAGSLTFGILSFKCHEKQLSYSWRCYLQEIQKVAPFIVESSLEQEDFYTITVGCNDGISEIVFIVPEIVICLRSVNGPYLQPHAGMLMKASPEKQEH